LLLCAVILWICSNPGKLYSFRLNLINIVHRCALFIYVVLTLFFY
jgi:hypothetical protein